MQGDKNAGKDLFSALLEAKDPETDQGLTEAELISEARLLAVARTDNTITGTTSTLFYLLENRNAFSDIENCRFLTACIDKSMRLTPPIGFLLPREVFQEESQSMANAFRQKQIWVLLTTLSTTARRIFLRLSNSSQNAGLVERAQKKRKRAFKHLKQSEARSPCLHSLQCGTNVLHRKVLGIPGNVSYTC